MERHLTPARWSLQYEAQYLNARPNDHLKSEIFSLQGEPDLTFQLKFLAKNPGNFDQPIVYLEIMNVPRLPVDMECTLWFSDGHEVQTTKKRRNVLN